MWWHSCSRQLHYNYIYQQKILTLNLQKNEQEKTKHYFATILYILVEIAMLLVITATVIIIAAIILSLAVEIP